MRFCSLASLAFVLAWPLLAADSGKKPQPKANPQDVLVFANVGGEYGQPPPRPTPQNPAYYVAMAGGFRQEGPAIARDDAATVTADQVWTPLQKALAGQGYLPAGKDTPPPTLLIVFHWAALNPDVLEGGLVGAESDLFLNSKRMGDLVGATRVDRHLNSEYETMRENASERRYAIVVTAFDFAAATAEKREKKVVWRARLSVPAGGTTLAESIVPLIVSGAPFFGRDTPQPKAIRWDRAKVEVGEVTVADAPSQAAPAAVAKE